MKRIGFIGVGVMGKSMVRNLMKQGFQVSIYARSKEKVEEILNEGAQWCESIAEVSKNQDTIITIVGYPSDVEEVYFSEYGIMNHANKGTYLIDMTTTSPELSQRIFSLGLEKEMKVLDAPVTGGDTGAKNGTLSIMVGGMKDDFTTCLPILNAMGTTVVYAGAAGMGQHTKMANQIAIAGAIGGVSEALTYGKKVGLNLETMLESISSGSAGSWQMSNMAPRVLKEDFEPGFYMKHMIKDLDIAYREGKETNTDLLVLKTVLSMFKTLQDSGYEDLGTQALLKYYELEQ